MRIIYIPEDFHLIVNSAAKTLLRDYEKSSAIYLHQFPSVFEIINIIIQFEKDEIQITSLFNYDLSQFNIVETQDNYYISMSMYTACVIAYKSKVETDFSDRLLRCIQGVIPNIFNVEVVIRMFKEKNKRSFRSLEYSHRYIDILDDMYTLNNIYMKILNHSDLGRQELNKLFRFSVKFLVPVSEVNQIQSLGNIPVLSNDYNFYKDRFYDCSGLGRFDTDRPQLVQYLNNISREDKYTSNHVSIEFRTSISDMVRFAQDTVRTYKETVPHVKDILPVSTGVDMYASISIADLVRCSNVNLTMDHVKDMMLFRNSYMDFAINGNKEEK
jgi:hypothetical protein